MGTTDQGLSVAYCWASLCLNQVKIKELLIYVLNFALTNQESTDLQRW